MKFIKLILTIIIFMGVQMKTNADSSKLVVLDVRTQGEYNEGHVAGTLLIDFHGSDFKEQVSKLDKTKTYKVYCRSGNRAGQALNLMKSLGFTDVENLGGLQQALSVLNKKCEGSGC